MFVLCSFDQIFANSLLDVCCEKIEKPNTPAILRQGCAAYIASFIARAKYIPISTVQTCMDLICHWIHCYIDEHDASSLGPDANKYGPFYSVCQALFYIFVFRHKQLLELEAGLKYIRKLNLERIVTCRMNPLKVFENVILPTHASCHVQFVMFVLCSFDQIFANSLLDVCCEKIEKPNTPAILRQGCAAYIASFIARAKYIPISTVQTCMDLICHWIHCYIDEHDASSLGPDANKYGPFYSVCQALFYIFVFRHKQLLELEAGLKYIRKLNLERIVTCRMNPLKVCLPTIVKTFAHITRQHEIVFCYTIIERNNRMLLPVATKTTNHSLMNLSFINQLDSYFPFDPYLLKRSGKFITPIYQEWEGLEHYMDEDHEEKKLSDAEDEEEEYFQCSRSPDVAVPEFTPEETSMCISPGFDPSSVPSYSHG
ncbi:PREDICTED: RNA polymerase I-specific transcription initiation factor RRN3-like [Acropora digitifera]|uniref:RNA polymerase I-specific transcription initiation factor RRN3-like n=1 Tax=Acropora digitifera TaxID=70779 RepID=UPI00077A8447|nr:PREDICTED: RNA polymerase I-specific transcription initiation factor RRN3-like [Acropora digitifera]